MARKLWLIEDEAHRLFVEAEKAEEEGHVSLAISYLRQAALLGYSAAQLNLGNYYSNGKGVDRSFRTAAYWYKKAYLNGDKDGALNLAIDKKNRGKYAEAIRWLRRAMEMGSGDASLELARLYIARSVDLAIAIDILSTIAVLTPDEASELTKEKASDLLEQIRKVRVVDQPYLLRT